MRLGRPEFLRRHPHVEALVVLAALAGLAAASVVLFGLYNVSARVSHLPPVHWALHTTYEQAVRLRAAPAGAVPGDLDDPARVRLGAQHFDAACRQCHGAPGEIQQATVRRMRPQPPHVTEAVEGWAPRHLHWIVFEGVKMSGMPAWPSPRPDEPWSTVAFLEAARDMDGRAWEALVARPDVEDGPHAETFAFCAGCHGTNGTGELAPFVPRLDILGADYIARSLENYRAGRRPSGYMRQAASEPPPEALAAMAERFGALPPGPPGPAPDPTLAAEGEGLAKAGGPDDPACAACHGPPAPARAAFPNLSGQHEGYLAVQLRLWREGDRGGELSELMHAAAVELSDAEIAALAAYYASLPPSRPATGTAAR
jgi:cytochrome c553